MKKVLSLVLVIAMILSSFSFAFAANFEDVEGDYEKAINTLVGLGVVTGYEDGTFKPERIVTRAEMAKLIVEILGYGDLVAGSKSNFADTQGHWADAWIALAAGRGIVVGDGDGNFRPDAQVSYDEAITMIVRALGYTDDCNELKGMTWPTNFKVKAADLKLTKDVKIVGTGADRGGVAQLLFNALEANMVTVDTDGNVNYVKDGEDNKILLNALAKKDRFVVAPKHLDEDDKEYKGDIVDLTPYMYQDIKVFVNDDDEVVYVTKVESDVKVGEFRKTVEEDGTTKSDNKVNIRIDGKNKAYTLAYAEGVNTIPVFYNGVEIDMTEAQMEDGNTSIVDLHKAAATFVLNDEGQIVAIVAEKYTDAARVANEYNGKTKLEGYLLPLDDDDEVDYSKLTVRGAVDTLEDIEEDDVIVLFAGKGVKNAKTTEPEKLVIEVVRDTVEGKITETNKDGDFFIDGEYYALSLYAPDALVAVGDEGTFFLDNKGDIIDFEPGSESSPVDYAIVTEFWDGYVTENGKEIKPEITLVNASGEEVTYNVKSTATIKVNSVDKPLLEPKPKVVDEVEYSYKEIKELDSKNYAIVKYSVNSKDEITKMTLVDQVKKEDPTVTKRDTTKATFVLASNVLVFNLDGDDVTVVDDAKLGDKIDVLFKDVNKNGEINFLFVKGLGSSDTYAFITAAGTALNDDDVEVQKLTAYVNGEKKTYLTDAIDTVTSSAIDAYKIYKLDLDGDVVEDIIDVPFADAANTKSTELIPAGLGVGTEITRVNGNRIRTGNDPYNWYTLADDVAVYVLDDTEFDSVGDISSVYNGAKVAGYAFDEDNIDDKVIEILFIFEGEEPAEDPEPDPDPATGEVTYIDGTNATNLVIQVTDNAGNFKNYKAADGEISAAVVNFLLDSSDNFLFPEAGMTFGFASNGAINSVKTVKVKTAPAADFELPFDGMVFDGNGLDINQTITVAADDVTIKNIVDGNVDIVVNDGVENVTVTDVDGNELDVQGGGENSVVVNDSKFATVKVNSNKAVRIVLNDTEATNVVVAKKDAKVEIAGTGSVATLTADAAVEVTGADKVEEVEANAEGVVLDEEPGKVSGTKPVEIGGETITEEDRDLAEATAAVEAAEAEAPKVIAAIEEDLSLASKLAALQETIDAAQLVVDAVDLSALEDGDAKTDLVERKAAVQDLIDSAQALYNVVDNGKVTGISEAFDNDKATTVTNVEAAVKGALETAVDNGDVTVVATWTDAPETLDGAVEAADYTFTVKLTVGDSEITTTVEANVTIAGEILLKEGSKDAQANMEYDLDDEAVGVEYKVIYDAIERTLNFYVKADGEPVNDDAELAYLVINVADKNSTIGDRSTSFARGAYMFPGYEDATNVVAGGDFEALIALDDGWYVLSLLSADFEEEVGVIVTAATKKPACYVENTLYAGDTLTWTYDNFIKFANPAPGVGL